MKVMKILSLILLIISFQSLASEPRSCEGSKSEIKEMLVNLAIAAKKYYETKGELPRASWTQEMADIIHSVPDSEKFGNIDSAGDGQRIEMICSELKNSDKYTHHIYYIDVKTLEISHKKLKQY